MPLPLIPITIGAGVTALLGIGKGVKAGMDNKEAKDVNERAEDIVEKARKKLGHAREKTGRALNSLGSTKVDILTGNMTIFVEEFSKLKNVDFKETDGLREISKLQFDKQTLSEMREMSSMAISIAGGLAGGAAGGALTAFGAYGAAMTFASASTGTAISALSGVAATNATLAFFGGGSLAAGGLGVAGGTMVLGGLVAGPALMIMGFIMGANASKNLDNAYSNLAQARKIAEELDIGTVLCKSIAKTSNLYITMLNQLDEIFAPLCQKLKEIISQSGADFAKYTSDEKADIAKSVSLAQAIKKLLDTSILNNEGALTEESVIVVEEIKAVIKTA